MHYRISCAALGQQLRQIGSDAIHGEREAAGSLLRFARWWTVCEDEVD